MKILLQVLFFSILFISCRQEIVSPDNPAGNINEPFYSRTNFSYSFSINADNITRTVIDNTFLNTTKSRIYLVINDYSSGEVEVRIHNGDNYLIYSSILDYNTGGVLEEFNGYQPKIITMKFVDFTGKFKVTLVDRE